MEIKTIKDEPHSFRFYCRSENLLKIISNRKLIFCTWALIGYLGQFLLVISSLNHYSDHDRLLRCGSSLDISVDPSHIYDVALFLISIYHMIEFIRFTIFMTAAFI